MKKNSFLTFLLSPILLFSTQTFAESITGNAYDLKRTFTGEASSLTCSKATRKLDSEGRSELIRLISEFFAKGWDRELLDTYYSPNMTLMASCFFCPSCDIEPFLAFLRGFRPSGICFIYKGSVKAPMSGKIRFIGAGDDLVAMRFNNELVLEAGSTLPSLYSSKMKKHKNLWSVLGTLGRDEKYQKGLKRYRKKQGYQLIPHDEYPHWTKTLGGLVAGPVIEVKEGEEYPIEVLYADIDGTGSGLVLLYQKMSDIQKDDPTSGIKIFRTNFALPTEKAIKGMTKKTGTPDPLPAFDPDTPIWKP